MNEFWNRLLIQMDFFKSKNIVVRYVFRFVDLSALSYIGFVTLKLVQMLFFEALKMFPDFKITSTFC